MPNHAGLGSGPSSAIHMLMPEPDEEHVLERVDAVVADRRLVQRGDVPGVEVRAPTARTRRRGGVSTRSAPHAGSAQHRREQRAGQAEDEQQRARSPSSRCSSHVRPEQLVGERRPSGETSAALISDEAAEKHALPPARDRARVSRAGVRSARR